HAAVLFFDFLIGDEGQHILAKRQFVTVSRSIESPFNQGPLQLIDSAVILDHARKWQDLYQKTVIGPSRRQETAIRSPRSEKVFRLFIQPWFPPIRPRPSPWSG